MYVCMIWIFWKNLQKNLVVFFFITLSRVQVRSHIKELLKHANAKDKLKKL